MSPRSVTIIGGGISGLVTDFALQRAGWDVTVYEASDRFGGKIWSSPVGDRLVDAGPDTFLARVPQGRQLCEDLGLADEPTGQVVEVGGLLDDLAGHRESVSRLAELYREWQSTRRQLAIEY